MMHGESGAGKTFVAIDITLSIVYGISDWFGCKIKQKYNVLYFSGEGNNAIGKRVKAFQQERKLQGQTGNFILCDNAIPLMVNGKINKEIKTFIKMLPFKPDLIVFDTVNIFMNEGDENSNTDCGRFIDTVRELNRVFNCATLLIHHTGKDQNQKSNPRGASALRGALDIEISILKQTDNSLKIMQTKNKDSEIQEPFYLKKEIVNLKNTFDEDGIQETSIVLKSVNKTQDKEMATIQKQKENLKKIVIYYGQSVIVKGLNEQQEIQLTRKHLEEYFTYKGGQNPINQAEVFTSRDIEPLIKSKIIHKIGKGKNCILSINDTEWTDYLLNEINIETDIEF
jgi:RecA-family ATPase